MAKIIYKPNILEANESSCFLPVKSIREALYSMAEFNTALADLLHKYDENCFIVSIHDLEIPKDMWGVYPVQENDEIIISHDIGYVATFFWLIFSGYIGMMAGGAALASLAIGLIVNAAIYAINYFTRSDPPRSGSVNDYTSTSPTYGWSGIVTTSDVDRPIPPIYGKIRVGGNVVNHYISTDGDKNYWNVLLSLGQGPIGGIWKADGTGLCSSNSDTPDILVNGNPIINYGDNITWDYRLGTLDQEPMEDFDATYTVFPISNIKIMQGGYIYTTSDDVEAVELKLSCLSGLWQMDGQGNIGENSVTYNIKYKIHGTSEWTDDGNYTITDKSKTALFRYYKRTGLDGRYDFWISRVNDEQTGFNVASDLYLTAVSEIVYERLSYPGIVLLAVKMLATEYLQGELPNFQILVNGRTVMVPKLTYSGNTVEYDRTYWNPITEKYIYATWDGGIWVSDLGNCIDTGNWVAQTTKNPIWNTLDFITSKRYGDGEHINLDAIDLSRESLEAKYAYELAKRDADLNEYEHRFEMDGVIDGQSAAVDLICQMSSTFCGYPIWIEGAYKILIDRPQTPSQLLTKGNIVRDSFKWAFYPLSQRPNSITGSFLDQTNEYARDSRQGVDSLVYQNNLPLRPHSINLPLVTRESQVLRILKYLLNCSKHRTQAIECVGGIDSIHLQGGDTFYFSHDVNLWQIGGRIIAIDGTSVTLDRPVTLSEGNDYKITIRLPDPANPGKEMFESKNIVFDEPGTYEVITIAEAFSVIPIAWETVYVVGLQIESIREFRALSVGDDEKRNVSIKAIETSDAIWSGDVTLINPIIQPLPGALDPPGDVTDLIITETASKPGIIISFNKPESDPNWYRAEILLSLDNKYWYTINAGFQGKEFEYYDVTPGLKYYVKVVSYSKLNIPSLNPPTANIQLSGVFCEPPDIIGLELEDQGNDTTWYENDPKFAWRPIFLRSGAGLGDADSEILNAGEGYPDSFWLDYKLEIWVDDVKVREENTKVPYYTYAFDKNIADNDGNPAGILTIKVWNRSIYNVVSINPAVLTVTKAAPPVPMYLTAVSSFKTIFLNWTNQESNEDYIVEIWRSDTNDRDLASKIGETPSDSYADIINAYNVTRYYWIRSRNIYGICSDFEPYSPTNGVSATTAGDLPDEPPSPPTGLVLTTGVSFGADGSEYAWIFADWNDNPEDDINYYEIRVRETTSEGYIYLTATPSERIISPVRANVLHYVGVRAIDRYNNKSAFCSDESITVAKDTTPPGEPTSLSASAAFQNIFLKWTNPADTDLAYIEIFRANSNNRGAATSVAKIYGTFYADYIGSYGVPRYYWIRAVDTSENISLTEAGPVNATTAYVGTTDIGTFAIGASQLFTKIPVPSGDSWGDNSPSGGYVAWNAHKLYYNGTEYSISAGNTSLKYIYWLNGSSSYSTSNTNPTLTDADFIIATNVSGYHDLAWNAIANQVIGTAYIQNAAIVNALIADLAVDNAKISDLNATKINAGDIEAARMQLYAGGAINAGSTLILPGKIQISGGTTLSDWRHGSDQTKIDGGDIYLNSITANKIVVGARNVSIQGIEISANYPVTSTLYWTAGVITYVDDTGTAVDASISSGSQLWTTETMYLYWVKGNTSLSVTGTKAVAFDGNNLVFASYRGTTDLVANYGRTIIDGSDIVTGTIRGTQLYAQDIITVTAQIGDAVITGAKIQNLAVDTAQIASAAIKEAKIDNLQVSTSKVAANAITNRSEAVAASYIVTGATFVNILTLNVTANSGGVIAIGKFNWGTGAGVGDQFEIQLVRDSTIIDGPIAITTAEGGNSLTAILTDTDAPGSGTFTYKLQGRCTGAADTMVCVFIKLIATEYLK